MLVSLPSKYTLENIIATAKSSLLWASGSLLNELNAYLNRYMLLHENVSFHGPSQPLHLESARLHVQIHKSHQLGDWQFNLSSNILN